MSSTSRIAVYLGPANPHDSRSLRSTTLSRFHSPSSMSPCPLLPTIQPSPNIAYRQTDQRMSLSFLCAHDQLTTSEHPTSSSPPAITSLPPPLSPIPPPHHQMSIPFLTNPTRHRPQHTITAYSLSASRAFRDQRHTALDSINRTINSLTTYYLPTAGTTTIAAANTPFHSSLAPYRTPLVLHDSWNAAKTWSAAADDMKRALDAAQTRRNAARRQARRVERARWSALKKRRAERRKQRALREKNAGARAAWRRRWNIREGAGAKVDLPREATPPGPQAGERERGGWIGWVEGERGWWEDRLVRPRDWWNDEVRRREMARAVEEREGEDVEMLPELCTVEEEAAAREEEIDGWDSKVMEIEYREDGTEYVVPPPRFGKPKGWVKFSSSEQMPWGGEGSWGDEWTEEPTEGVDEGEGAEIGSADDAESIVSEEE